MTFANRKAIDEAEIRELIEDRAKAVRAKDIDGSVFNYAPDIVSFDVVNDLQKIGLDACRNRAEKWFSSFNGPIGYEIRDLSITAGEDVAFSHSLNRVKGTKTDGGDLEMWWRATVCYRKLGGKWIVTHEHSSVPFDVNTGKASLDLKPKNAA
ncbi:MAG: nuclear transport factor 2 family protein [Blastocatellia bacterium]